MKNPRSIIAFWLVASAIFATGFFYYPKWKMQWTEATISWDVSGYYFYLPALFIHKDIKQLKFSEKILADYKPTPDLQQAFLHESGNYVLKYPAGQAIQYLPFFGVAHVIALNTDYAADGFSRPYQLLISIGSWLIAFLGIWYLRKVLLLHFSDTTTAVTLVLVALGTNYLDYSAINGAMTHNNLFTIYCLVIWLTHHFYKKPTYGRSLGIGLLVGIAALTRPTEIIIALIPLLWGLPSLRFSAIKERLFFFRQHSPKLMLAVFATALVGSFQLIYWKYASGDWIVYSYQDQGFSWLKPHFYMGIFSAQSGWLVYSPIMGFGLLGFGLLYRNYRDLFWGSLIFSMIFIYITFAWDIWWYGGSLGIRAMVQAYPVLAFPLAAFVAWVWKKPWMRYLFIGISVLFIYYNVWLTHQAHKGGLLRPGEMTNAYFWRILGRYDVPIEAQKLLDNKDHFEGEPENSTILYQNDFETDTIACALEPVTGSGALCLNRERQYSPEYTFPLSPSDAQWLRATATFRCRNKEWNIWRSTVFFLRLYQDDQLVKERYLRVYRLLYDGQTSRIHMDFELPDAPYNRAVVQFWNGDGDKPMVVDDLTVVEF